METEPSDIINKTLPGTNNLHRSEKKKRKKQKALKKKVITRRTDICKLNASKEKFKLNLMQKIKS